MVTDKTDGLDGLSEQAVRSIAAARIAAVLMFLPTHVMLGGCPLVADRIVPGFAIARYPRWHPSSSHPRSFGVEMRRLAVIAIIAVTLPSRARAQACLGSVSFATVPVRLGGGAAFGKDYTAYAASLIAGKENGVFGDVGVSRTYYDDYDDTADDLFAEFGWQRMIGTRAQLCPVVGASIGNGPDDDDLEVKSRYASADLALGITLHPAPSVKIIPNGSLRYAYGAADVTEATGKETYTDNSGVAELGIGLLFFRDRLAIQPMAQLPFASDDNSVSYGIVFSVGFGLRR